VATYLAKQGRGTSNAVAAKLFEVAPDVFGLRANEPADEARLARLSAQLEELHALPALPANDTARPARAAVAARAPAPAHDAGTSFAAPRTGADFARLVERVALAHGMRKCPPDPRWLSGSYTTTRVYRIVVAMR
jgi:hypothetical protein